MNLLLDTHVFRWFIGNDSRLSNDARLAIESPANQKWVSIATCWEIAIKSGLGKLQLADPVEVFLPREIAANRFSLLPIELRHATFVADLANHHRDPFDRLLITPILVYEHTRKKFVGDLPADGNRLLIFNNWLHKNRLPENISHQN